MTLSRFETGVAIAASTVLALSIIIAVAFMFVCMYLRRKHGRFLSGKDVTDLEILAMSKIFKSSQLKYFYPFQPLNFLFSICFPIASIRPPSNNDNTQRAPVAMTTTFNDDPSTSPVAPSEPENISTLPPFLNRQSTQDRQRSPPPYYSQFDLEDDTLPSYNSVVMATQSETGVRIPAEPS